MNIDFTPEPCPRCSLRCLLPVYDTETGEHGRRCEWCRLVLRNSDLPEEPPLTDEEINRMADEAALDDLCARRGRR